jgi:hypothetical protein
LVSIAGLIPTLRLAETAGLHDLLEQRLSVASPNPVAKATCVIGGMLAGADSIDDLDLLRHGAMGRLFDGLRAPSTLGTYLRSFTHGHVQQLDAVAARVLAGLTTQVPALIVGAEHAQGLALIDLDDTIREVHGYAKQGAAYGYSKVRGLNAQLAVLSTPLAAPVILKARLRRGNVASATGAARITAQAISSARAAGVRAQILARADSAYYGHAFVGTALRHGAWFSVTARMTATVKTAITNIDESAWDTIEYPNAIYDEAEQRWISDAEVAEVPFTAFTGRRKADHVTCRLVVRRIKRHQRLASDGTEQGALFATYRHHAFITNSTLGLIEADQTHREHAIVEQVIAELKDGPLAHLPSGSYAANAAWLGHAVIAFNLARAAAVAAGAPKIRWATLRERIIKTPARIASTARRLILHLPQHWPWQQAWQSLWSAVTDSRVVLQT